MTEYVNMWKNFANFSDRTDERGYWMAYLINVIITVVRGGVTGVLAGITGVGAFTYLSTLYGLAVLIPNLAILVRRLRDVGRPWFHMFISLIPCAGVIILIVWIVKPSIPDDGVPQV